MPDDASEVMVEGEAPAEDTAPFYCDQCGLRYETLGVCTGTPESPHAAVQVVPLEPGPDEAAE